MPRVILQSGGSSHAVPLNLAIRTESLVDFVARQNLSTDICGPFGAGLRQVVVFDEAGHRFSAVERLGYRGFLVHPPTPERVEAVIKVREFWRARRRSFSNDAEGVAHALELQKQAITSVGPDTACDLFLPKSVHTGNCATWQHKSRNAGRILSALVGATMITILSDLPAVFLQI